MLQLMRCILEAKCDGGDNTAVDLLFQNRSIGDVLLRTDIDACVERRPSNFAAQVCRPTTVCKSSPPTFRRLAPAVQYFLSCPPPGWGAGGVPVPREGSDARTQVEGYISARHVADVLSRG